MDGLRRVCDAARARRADLVLIAGDLFDSARVETGVVDETVAELQKLHVPVVVIPGNHDCVNERSIYHRVDLRDAGDHVTFAGDPDGEEVRFEELGLVIWARGIENHDPRHRPLAGYAPADPSYWRVVLTHGHYVERGEDSYRSSQITQDEIAGLDCDYVALGHWHRFTDVSQGRVMAFYSGSPADITGAPASANLVTLDPSVGVTVDRVDLGDPDGLRRL